MSRFKFAPVATAAALAFVLAVSPSAASAASSVSSEAVSTSSERAYRTVPNNAGVAELRQAREYLRAATSNAKKAKKALDAIVKDDESGGILDEVMDVIFGNDETSYVKVSTKMIAARLAYASAMASYDAAVAAHEAEADDVINSGMTPVDGKSWLSFSAKYEADLSKLAVVLYSINPNLEF